MRPIVVDHGSKEKLCKEMGAEVFIDFTQTKDTAAAVVEATGVLGVPGPSRVKTPETLPKLRLSKMLDHESLLCSVCSRSTFIHGLCTAQGRKYGFKTSPYLLFAPKGSSSQALSPLHLWQGVFVNVVAGTGADSLCVYVFSLYCRL